MREIRSFRRLQARTNYLEAPTGFNIQPEAQVCPPREPEVVSAWCLPRMVFRSPLLPGPEVTTEERESLIGSATVGLSCLVLSIFLFSLNAPLMSLPEELYFVGLDRNESLSLFGLKKYNSLIWKKESKTGTSNNSVSIHPVYLLFSV